MEQDVNQLFQSMYEEYQAPLRIIAKRSGMPYDEIDDMIQETFISYYQHYPLTYSNSHKKSLLAKIIRNKCIDYFRKNEHFDNVSLEACEGPGALEAIIISMNKDILETILDDERYGYVRSCIAEMREDWKSVVLLRLVQGLSTKETCAILGITGTACRSRLSKARKYLKEVLGPKV